MCIVRFINKKSLLCLTIFATFKRRGLYGTGNPCPICRDEFLVVDYKVKISILNSLSQSNFMGF